MEIEKAIKYYEKRVAVEKEQEHEYEGLGGEFAASAPLRKSVRARHETVLAALRSQQEREENKPLTLEHGFDITNADGTPIDYDALGRKYKDKLCYCDIDGFYIGEDGQLVLMDDCGTSVSVDRGDYHIEARKPEED